MNEDDLATISCELKVHAGRLDVWQGRVPRSTKYEGNDTFVARTDTLSITSNIPSILSSQHYTCCVYKNHPVYGQVVDNDPCLELLQLT